MTTSKRRVALTKRVSLADIADNWTDECYADVLLADFEQVTATIKAKDKYKTDEAANKYMMSVVKANFVGGRIPILQDDSSIKIEPMQVEDIDASALIFKRLWAAVNGVDLDPKALQTVMDSLPTKPDTTEPSPNESNTKISSSTE